MHAVAKFALDCLTDGGARTHTPGGIAADAKCAQRNKQQENSR
jgi:hypothetical protein